MTVNIYNSNDARFATDHELATARREAIENDNDDVVKICETEGIRRGYLPEQMSEIR